MLDAHSDEVGFMVQCIKPDGTLRFAPLGRMVECNLPAHRVRVLSADGVYVPGVVATKPPHFLSEAERKALPALENMRSTSARGTQSTRARATASASPRRWCRT